MAGKIRLRHLSKKAPKAAPPREIITALRKGDPVMVIAGGNPKRGRVLKGQVGKILKLLPKKGRVIVEGLNVNSRHKRPLSSNDTGGIVKKEGSIDISNVMYYVERISAPVRLATKTLEDGRRVRAFKNPKTGNIEQIEV